MSETNPETSAELEKLRLEWRDRMSVDMKASRDSIIQIERHIQQIREGFARQEHLIGIDLRVRSLEESRAKLFGMFCAASAIGGGCLFPSQAGYSRDEKATRHPRRHRNCDFPDCRMREPHEALINNAMKTIHHILTLVLCLAFAGCSWTPAKRAAIATELREDAAKLGSRLLTAAENAALQYIATGQVDFVHVAADVLWKNGGAADLQQLIADATGNPALAATAMALVQKAQDNGLSRQDAAYAVAAALSSTALTK